MMHFIMLTLMAAIDASPQFQPNDMKGFANPVPEIQAHAADAVNSLVNDIMGQVQPALLSKIKNELGNVQLLRTGKPLQLGAGVNIDVSPIFDINVYSDMAGSFHDNNNAGSFDADVVRVNGAMAVADFQNSLHDNNNAIAKSKVYRVNGVGIDSSVDSTSSMLSGAANSIGGVGGMVSGSSSPSAETAPPAISLRQTNSQTVRSVSNKSIGSKASADAFVSIRVNPAFRIRVGNNMTQAFYNNNNAMSTKGDVQRVNGGMAVANFSGSLYNNSGAMSTDWDVQRANGVDMDSQAALR